MSSLIDAFLFEAPKFDVWIAARTDGQIGSGTQADPWNGTAYTAAERPAKNITSLVRSGLIVTATVADHGFVPGDWVTVAGVSQTVSGDRFYMGTFQVLGSPAPTTNTFAYQTLYEAVSSTAQLAASPEGPMRCWRERERFDAIMRTLGPGTCIHIGPGVFETKGNNAAAEGLRVQSQQRIMGAGMGATILKLVNASHREVGYAVFFWDYYNSLHNDFQVSDLTVDCNIEGQLTQYVSCAALALSGRHIRVQRVRAINFGSQTLSYIENFVFSLNATTLAGHETVGCVFEDCVAEQPGHNLVNNSTVFLFGGGESTPEDGTHYNHRGCTMRNNYLNTELWFGPLLQIDTITHAGDTATLKTKTPHGLATPANIAVRGAAVGGVFDNPYNGVFAIESVISADQLTYKPHSGPSGSASGGTLNGGLASHAVSIESIAAVQGFSNRYRLTTRDPHFRTKNNRVLIHAIRIKPDLVATSAAFNGSFKVEAYTANTIDYIVTNPDAALNDLDFGAAFVNTGHIGLSPDHGTGALCTGNRTLHCHGGGPYHDTWQTRDLATFDCYYHDVVAAPTQALTGISFWSDGVRLSSLDYDDGHFLSRALALHPFAAFENSTVIAQLDPTDPFDSWDPSGPRTVPHGLSVGNRVVIFGDGSKDAGLYNGAFNVTEVPNPWTFKYEAITTVTAKGSETNGTTPRATSKFRPTALTGPRDLRPLQSLTAEEDQTSGKCYATAVVASIYGSKKHGLQAGDSVQVNWSGHAYYNGNKKVTATPDEKTFKYEIAGDPGVGSGTSSFAPGYYGRIWQFHNLVLEGNLIELAIRTLPSDYGRSEAVFIFIGNHPPQYSGRRLVIRENVIRNIDNKSDVHGYNRAIQIWGILGYGAENSLVQTNVVRLDSTANTTDLAAIEYLGGGIQTFDNNSPDGALLYAIEKLYPTYAKGPELVTSIRAALDDALLMTLT